MIDNSIVNRHLNRLDEIRVMHTSDDKIKKRNSMHSSSVVAELEVMVNRLLISNNRLAYFPNEIFFLIRFDRHTYRFKEIIIAPAIEKIKMRKTSAMVKPMIIGILFDSKFNQRNRHSNKFLCQITHLRFHR